MPPATRSGGNAKPSSSKRTLEDDVDSSDDGSSTKPEAGQGTTLQSLLTRALGGVKELERENEALRKKVNALESRLDRVVEQDDAPQQPRRRSKKAPATAAELRSQVTQLQKQVGRLEKSKEKYRKRVHQLSMKELKSEAEDLLDVADLEVGDSAHVMRKLLRRFSDLMLTNSLDGDEQCPICLEHLQPKLTRSLPCQHIFCNGCLGQLRPVPGGDERISCPQCREVCEREDADLVEYTALEQWDELVEVATQWVRIDVARREEDTSEEEGAVDFIDDGLEEESSTTASEPPAANPLESSPEPQREVEQDALPPTPSRLRRRRAVASPTPEAESTDNDNPVKVEPDMPLAAFAESPKQEQSSTPPLTPHTPTQQEQSTPSYSQSPSKDKRKMLEQLAEARNKKRRF
ncbi:hypothetical protein TRAPUB_2028 [Trametes pubescens]|uniref:RING-type domain-containing protein n=1 Tax=Trametes pubescens TaxID=154538 RepID=A0A1M2VHK9_TRAPU|nr:hypothetical protein TRAPUB_2028 [Trametes pubescens]